MEVIDDSANNQYLIQLTDQEGKIYSSRVLSEGTLRILALCILEQDPKHQGLLCFEEPENGVHPLRIKAMTQLLNDLSSNFGEGDEQLRQVIVNTHSPVLVAYIHQWQEDPHVGIWFAEMRKRITDVEGVRTGMQVTRIVPVMKENTHQTTLPFTEQERKLSLYHVQQYLSTSSN